MTVALMVLSILVIVFAAIDLFTQGQVLTIDRRSKVQNELAYILEHSAKQISKAIGNTKIDRSSSDGDQIIKTDPILGDTAIEFYAENNYNGVRDNSGATPDNWMAYRLRPSTADPATESYQLWYCPSCATSGCLDCTPAWGTADNILGKKVKGVTYAYDPAGNYVDISITGCWDPSGSATNVECGTSDRNPSTSMSTRISLPLVTTD